MRGPRRRRARLHGGVRRSSWAAIVAAPVVALLFVGGTIVQTAANTVTAGRAGLVTGAITANALKPTACAGLDLTAIVTGSGTFGGSGASELIVGGAGIDKIRGRAGDDCVVGGAGGDDLRGDGGTDVCIGGPEVDTFNGDCETQVQ